MPNFRKKGRLTGQERRIHIVKSDPSQGEDPLNANSGDFITFFNEVDRQDYLIELTRKGNPTHDPICLYIPAGTIATVATDPNDTNATCTYQILNVDGKPVGLKPGETGGSSGHSIIIGTGLENKKTGQSASRAKKR
jgi:hypothetical protein